MDEVSLVCPGQSDMERAGPEMCLVAGGQFTQGADLQPWLYLLSR